MYFNQPEVYRILLLKDVLFFPQEYDFHLRKEDMRKKKQQKSHATAVITSCV